MQEVWAVIAVLVIALIIYGIVSSKIKARRQRAERLKQLPYVEASFQPGQHYHVHLSDGRAFRDVELLGTNDRESGEFALGGWTGMLVLKQPTGKRVFVRQGAVRCVEEA